MRVHIVSITNGTLAEKLAEATVCLNNGPLSGSKLVGFETWKGRRGWNLTVRARQYSVNEGATTTDPLRDWIFLAYVNYEKVCPLGTPCSVDSTAGLTSYFPGRLKNAGVSSDVSSSSRSPSSCGGYVEGSAGNPTIGRRAIGTSPPTARVSSCQSA